MAFNFDGGRFTRTYRDSSGETSTLPIFTIPMTNANLLGLVTEANDFYAGAEQFQEAATVVAAAAYGEDIYGPNPGNVPTNAECQRETTLRIYVNDVDGNTASFSLPCADLTAVQLVPGGGDAVNIDAAPWPAISAALQAGPFTTRYGSRINGIAKVLVKGRNS